MKQIVVGTLVGLMALSSQAEQRPRWELGLGLAGITLPEYRGSDERRGYVLPAPYLVYRGDVLKADRDGARAQLIGLEGMHLDLGLGLSAPVSSSRNKARAGMPNLPGTVEVGPALDATLYRDEDAGVKLRFRLPVTYGITLEKPVGGNGWQASPKLVFDKQNVLGLSGWNAGFQTGLMWSTRQRHAYFYDVAPQFATADRPAYRAGAGYAGAQFSAGLSKRFERVWFGVFARYENLNGAVFTDSPLVKTRHYVVGGVALSWVLGQSSEMVAVD